MKYLGVDYGTKRVGVAASDASGRLAFPKAVFGNDQNLLVQIEEMIKSEGIEAIVVGESKGFLGRENAVMEEIKDFSAKLGEKTGMKVIFEPEYYTTAQAKRFTGKTDKEDAQAAALILQSFLDKKND